MTAVPPEIRTRGIKLLGMLGSSFDGERAAAGLLIDKLLKENSLTWEDIWPDAVTTSSSSSSSRSQSSYQPPPPPPPPSKPQSCGHDSQGRYLYRVLTCLWQTERAWLFQLGDGLATVDCWLPKSQCAYEPTDRTVAIPAWLCSAKDLF
jgi:hypothetical protein